MTMTGINSLTKMLTVSGDHEPIFQSDGNVTLRLCTTSTLWAVLQEMRHKDGLKGDADFIPMIDLSNYYHTGDCKVCDYIMALIKDEAAEDNGIWYMIPFNLNDITAAHNTLDYQCRDLYGRGIDELLEEADKRRRT